MRSQVIATAPKTLDDVCALLDSLRSNQKSILTRLNTIETALQSTATLPSTLDAGSRVIKTFELLEKILLLLPLQQCLLSQRISCQFKEVIHSSLPLRRKLFLTTSPAIPTTPKDIQINSLLRCAGLPIFQDTLTHRLHYMPRHDRTRLIIHTLAILTDPQTGEVYLHMAFRPCIKVAWAESGMFKLPDRESRLMGAGSWKGMALTQPPVGVRWCVQPSGRWPSTLCGRVGKVGSVDELLDGLAESEGVAPSA